MLREPQSTQAKGGDTLETPFRGAVAGRIRGPHTSLLDLRAAGYGPLPASFGKIYTGLAANPIRSADIAAHRWGIQTPAYEAAIVGRGQGIGFEALRVTAQHCGNQPVRVAFSQQELRGLALFCTDCAAMQFDFIHKQPRNGVTYHGHLSFFLSKDGYARQGGDGPLPQPSVTNANLARGCAVVRNFGRRVVVLDRRNCPTWQGFSADHPILPFFSRSRDKFKCAARGAVARLINRPVSGDQKTGAGLPARAAFYSIRLGASSYLAASCGDAQLLPRFTAAQRHTRSGNTALGIVAHRQTRSACLTVGTGGFGRVKAEQQRRAAARAGEIPAPCNIHNRGVA